MSGGAKAAAETAATAAISSFDIHSNYAYNTYWRSQRRKQQESKLYHRNLKLSRGAKDEYGYPLRTNETWPIVKGDFVEVTHTGAKRARGRGTKGERIRNENGEYIPEDWLGMRGEVLRVMRKTNRIVVAGVNLRTRVAQPTHEKGGHFYKMESPIPYHNVSLYDQVNKQVIPPSAIRVLNRKMRVTYSGVKIIKPWFAEAKEKWIAKHVIPPGQTQPPVSKWNPKSNSLYNTPAEIASKNTYYEPCNFNNTVRMKLDEKTGQPMKDQMGRIILEPEGIEMKTARMKF